MDGYAMMASAQPERTSNVNLRYLIPLFLSLNLPLFSTLIYSNNVTFYLLFATNILLSTLGAMTYTRARTYQTPLALSRYFPLFVQGSVQLSILFYVAIMHPRSETRHIVLSRMPLLFYQVIFAFVADYLLKVCRGEIYRPGFYLMPMVFSFNLFLWFMGDYAFLHLPTIILGILIKTFVVRTDANGRTSHIFNPSFILLSIFGVILYNFYEHTRWHIYDQQIFQMYEDTPGFDIWAFCVGCITLWLPNSYLISFGAYSIVLLLNAITLHFLGIPLFFGLVRGSVMIAIMLGITDPATSPQTKSGKFIFGVCYGLLLTFLAFFFVLLKFWYIVLYFKIFPIPLMNYYRSSFDNIIKFKYFAKLVDSYYLSRFISIAIFAMVFYITYQTLEASFVAVPEENSYFVTRVARDIWTTLGIK